MNIVEILKDEQISDKYTVSNIRFIYNEYIDASYDVYEKIVFGLDFWEVGQIIGGN